MVYFEVNERVADALSVGKCSSMACAAVSGRRVVSHGVLLRALRAAGASSTLPSVVRGCATFGTEADAAAAFRGPAPRDAALERRLAGIRARNEEREYAALVRDVAPAVASNAQMEAARIGRVGAQMSIGANVVVTMATCFAAGYFVFKASSGRQSVGLVGGIVCMIGAMAVEITLVITRMYAIDNAAEKERAAEDRRATNRAGVTVVARS